MANHFGSRMPFDDTRARRQVVLGGSLLLFLACGAAIATLYLTTPTKTQAVQNSVPENQTLELTTALVALRDIRPGTPLQKSHFKRISIPTVSLGDHVVENYEEVTGAYARSVLVAGAPVYEQQISLTPPLNAIEDMIPAHHRAVTINVNERSAIAGFVQPGSRVDVLWLTTMRELDSCGLIRIVEDAHVLAVERETLPQNAQNRPLPTNVTLSTSADDASKIQLAQAKGQISLVLRPGDGNNTHQSSGSKVITCNSILGTKPSLPETSEVIGTLRMGGHKYQVLKDGSIRRVDKQQS